jgi:putative transposase
VRGHLGRGRRFRILNVIDYFNSGRLAAVPEFSLQGLRVVRELKLVVAMRGKRAMIVSDDGAELASDAVLCWAAERRIECTASRPAADPERLR